MKFLITLYVAVLTSISAIAKVKTEVIEYKHGDTVLEGYLAYDSAKARAGLPGVLVIHEWTGVGPFVKRRSEQLAELGYVGTRPN